MRNLRNAAAGIAAARTLEAMRSAAGQLAGALTAIGPSRLGHIIGGARAGVAKVDQENLHAMAGILQAEAGSDRDRPAMEAIGHTILNRMHRNGTALVADVAGAYAKPDSPKENTVTLAQRLLDGASRRPDGRSHSFLLTSEDVKGRSERVRRCRRRRGIGARCYWQGRKDTGAKLPSWMDDNVPAAGHARRPARHSEILRPAGRRACSLDF